MSDTISRQWLMECVSEGWIKFDTERDENNFIHLIRDIAPPAEPPKLWKERYEDLLEYFHGEDVILKDRKEFKAWLERCRWHVLECDKLARQLEAQPEPAIPLSWIENQIAWLESLDNAFTTLTASQISSMVKKWKDEQDDNHKR